MCARLELMSLKKNKSREPVVVQFEILAQPLIELYFINKLEICMDRFILKRLRLFKWLTAAAI